MEHKDAKRLFSEKNIHIEDEAVSDCIHFSKAIFKTNKKFNVTALKTIDDIFSQLVIQTIDPISGLDVPRGTSFVDIGTGSGVPGIPILLYFRHMNGMLMDSSKKKTDFIREESKEMMLNSVSVLCGRVEEIAHQMEFREKYDWVFSRAMASPFVVIEMASAFIKIGGFCYIYVNENNEEMESALVTHSQNLGFELVTSESRKKLNIKNYGYLFKKIEKINDKYPRRYSVIKREAKLKTNS